MSDIIKHTDIVLATKQSHKGFRQDIGMDETTRCMSARV